MGRWGGGELGKWGIGATRGCGDLETRGHGDMRVESEIVGGGLPFIALRSENRPACTIFPIGDSRRCTPISAGLESRQQG